VKASRWRVPLGYVAGVAVLLLARPTPLSMALGGTLAIVGEALRLWAAGHIRKTQDLATGGPYAHTRNPLYLGSCLMAVGLAVAAASPWVAGVAVLYFAALYPPVIREESAFLAERFGDTWSRWAREVPAFLPRLTPGGPRSSAFSWDQVRANREWRTAAGVPVVLALVYLRGFLH